MSGDSKSRDSASVRGKGSSVLSKPVVSWALYDLANTVFSMNIVSFFLSLWVIDLMGGTDKMWGWANSLSMLAMLLTAPLLGALSDRAGRRLPLLLASTLSCVLLTSFLGVPGVFGTLILFGLANYFFQAGLVFYDALLPVVSTPENRGRVSGFGVGVGYVGSFIGLGVGFALRETLGYEWVFRATAILFLVFAIPVFIWVKEPGKPSWPGGGRVIGGAFRQVLSTFRQVRHYRGLGRFLIGRAFYTDAANTLIVFMGPYVVLTIGYSKATTNILMMVAVAAAIVGGLAWGPVVDRLGPKRTLDLVLLTWIATLVSAAAIPVLQLPRALFWVVACATGIALGGTWASDRPLMLVLSPPSKVGEFYGLYSMIGRFAAVVGPVLWAFVAEDLGLGRPASVFVLAVMVVVALVILRRVDDEPRAWTPEESGVEGYSRGSSPG
ncbi:MFS transporter [Gemmatimonadota bacterium]